MSYLSILMHTRMKLDRKSPKILKKDMTLHIISPAVHITVIDQAISRGIMRNVTWNEDKLILDKIQDLCNMEFLELFVIPKLCINCKGKKSIFHHINSCISLDTTIFLRRSNTDHSIYLFSSIHSKLLSNHLFHNKKNIFQYNTIFFRK